MALPLKAVQEFKQIYLDEFGEELTDEEATEKANTFFDLFRLLAEGELDKQNRKLS